MLYSRNTVFFNVVIAKQFFDTNDWQLFLAWLGVSSANDLKNVLEIRNYNDWSQHKKSMRCAYVNAPSSVKTFHEQLTSLLINEINECEDNKVYNWYIIYSAVVQFITFFLAKCLSTSYNSVNGVFFINRGRLSSECMSTSRLA
jgi:hypothetical protein